MEQDNWQQVRQLFDLVCDLPAEHWEARLNHLSNDAQVIAQTLRLLQAQTLELGAVREQIGRLISQVDQAELGPGDRIGPWQLQQCLARGGMGMVFLAQRADGMYQQQVAIKLLPGMCDERAAAGLVAERRILASLQHPQIARLYDGGTTPAGQPYLVMEYVQGLALDQWLLEQAPDLNARLRLFGVICQAVQEAHARLVLHCDLKPANILIRADGQPVLVDFGVARLLEGAGSGEAAAYCTPAYAAPELLHGQSLADTRSDVFSLGVLLAELLGGARSERGLDSWNSAVALPGQQAAASCRWRAQLRGDLDAIVARACALEPDQRYPSVAALGRDLEAWRQRRPVSARGGGMFYRGQRWLQRNWKWWLLLLGLVALVAGFVWQLEQQRQRAQQQARIAEEVSRFLVDAFDAANPRKGSLPSYGQITARQVLDASAQRMQQQTWTDVAVKARLQATLAQAYQNIGLGSQAAELYEQAVPVLLEHDDGRNTEALVPVLNEYATLLANKQQGERAEGLARQALALLGSEQLLLRARSYNSLGLALSAQRRFDASSQAFATAMALHQRNGSGVLSIAMILQNTALMELERGDYARAASLLQQAGALRLPLGKQTSEWWGGQYLLLRAMAAQGRYDDALAIAQELDVLLEPLYGPHSDRRAELDNELAGILQDSGRYGPAAERYARVLAHYTRMGDGQSMDVARTLNNMATLQQAQGDWNQAISLYRQSLQLRRALLGPQVPQVWQVETNLARLLLARGDRQEAASLLENAASGWRQRVPADHPQRLLTALAQAQHALATGNMSAATAYIGQVAGQLPVDDLRVERRYLETVARQQQLMGDWSAAVGTQTKLLDLYTAQNGADSVQAAEQQVALALIHARSGQCALARSLAREAMPHLQQHHAASRILQQARHLAGNGSSGCAGALLE